MYRNIPYIPTGAILGSLALTGCASYQNQQLTQLYYQVPCGTTGAFEARISPPVAVTAPVPQAAPVPEAASPAVPPPAIDGQLICLASAGAVPAGYARRAYGYYDGYWWPYRRSYFGLGLGFGYGHGFHHRGGHHGGHSGGHSGGSSHH